jgi:hypothetical protein
VLPIAATRRSGKIINQKDEVKIMKWEYQVLRADTVENFQSSLNKLGSEGWEATSGTYAIGESKKVSLGQGMAPSIAVGASMWVALMKRVIPA